MAVKVVKSGSGILGTLGSIAQIGGMFIPGMQFLTPLGMGMSAVDKLMNGGSMNGEEQDALKSALEGATGWLKPTDGNIARRVSDAASKARTWADRVTAQTSEEDLVRTWRPYDNGGYNGWLR